jgi:hypothetical protein
MLWLLVHFDDMFIMGKKGEVEELFQKLQQVMKIRETGRVEKEGDTASFLNRTIVGTARGFKLAGNSWLVDQLVARQAWTDANLLTPLRCSTL